MILFMMKLVKENIEFKRGDSPAKALDVGSFRNMIDWENLPYRHYWRVVTPNNDCIIWLGPNSFYMIKNWMDDDGNEEWAPTWIDDDFRIGITSKFPEWLKKQGAFNLIEMVKVGYPLRPSWDALEPEVNENLDFKRNINPRKALDIGEKWKIGLYQGSYMYGDDTFYGSIENAQKFAAKRLLSNKDYQSKHNLKINFATLWAAFSKYKEKYKNEGRLYKDSKTGKIVQKDDWVSGWDEIFDYRIKLDEIDIKKLRFNDELIKIK